LRFDGILTNCLLDSFITIVVIVQKIKAKKRNSRIKGHALSLKSQNALLKELSHQLKSDITNASRQTEAYINLQAYLNGGHLLQSMHGWPISPDFGCLLVQRLMSTPYDLIIEFGSGTSTVLIAEYLKRSFSDKENQPQKKKYIAFEHLNNFLEETKMHLISRHLLDFVDLQEAKLKSGSFHNDTYNFYDCEENLKRLAEGLPEKARILVLVDGPPADTCHHARFPAFPVITNTFKNTQIDFLLDDYIREDEQEIAKKWESIAEESQWQFSATRYKLEKDAYLMQLVKLK
jgi:hypothetical protein